MNISSMTSQPSVAPRIQAASAEAREAPGINDHDADDAAGSSTPDVRATPPAGQGKVVDKVA